MECYALRKGRCKVLNVKKCEGPNCVFNKTEMQLKENKQKAMEKIKSLSLDKQMHISKEYYEGKMPWLKGGIKNDC